MHLAFPPLVIMLAMNLFDIALILLKNVPFVLNLLSYCEWMRSPIECLFCTCLNVLCLISVDMSNYFIVLHM